MSGRLIAIVGPSGVGKDSVMRALADQDNRFVLARRVITRPGDAGGEDFDAISEGGFLARQANGDFALSWPAHGLHYGIASSIDDQLAQGKDVLANLSRAVLTQARDRFDRFTVILLTANQHALAARLRDRGRESEAEIARRLQRANFEIPKEIDAKSVDNSGPIEQTIATISALLHPVSA
jgi:ribose 1,5-bisphosphokinase